MSKRTVVCTNSSVSSPSFLFQLFFLWQVVGERYCLQTNRPTNYRRAHHYCIKVAQSRNKDVKYISHHCCRGTTFNKLGRWNGLSPIQAFALRALAQDVFRAVHIMLGRNHHIFFFSSSFFFFFSSSCVL